LTSAALLSYSLLVLPLVSLLLASTVGGKAEKLGAAIFGLALALTWGAQMLGERASYPIFLAIDFGAAAAAGALTIRFPDKLWPGIAGCAQFLVLTFSITRALNFPLSETAYLYALNLSGSLVWGSLLAGTWASRCYRKPVDDWEVAAERLGIK
jgi:hypothetical protein